MRLQTFIYTANPPFSRLAITCATGVLVIIMARAVVTPLQLVGKNIYSSYECTCCFGGGVQGQGQEPNTLSKVRLKFDIIWTHTYAERERKTS